MRSASLLLVFVAAKSIVLAGHHLTLTWLSPFAYFWQDAAVVLMFTAVEWFLGRRQRAAWALYSVFALYAAINVPVARAVSTPLTWPMLGAARGPLLDSILYYATWRNVVLFLGVLACAAIGPWIFRRVHRMPLLIALPIFIAIGLPAAGRIDTHGLERNAWAALLTGVLPNVAAHAATQDWRASEFGTEHEPDLSSMRGAAAGKNVVLVSLESTAAQYLGLYGANREAMPNLSALARSAIVFDNAYAVYPESIKGLYSILCSAYPAFDTPIETLTSAPCTSLAGVLSTAGYRTSLFHSGRFMYLGMDAMVRNHGFDTLADAGDIGSNRNSSFGVDEPATVSSILKWIDALSPGQPFFVAYLPIAGHHPYDSPQLGPFGDRDEFGRYQNALHYGDRSLGTLIRGFEERGLDKKTLWILLGDHGEAFGQHDGNFGHTFRLYEENVHVPFLVAAPGLIPQQVRNRRVVSLMDTAPTILDLLGMEAPRGVQGESILDPKTRKALFFADYSLGMAGLRDGPLKFIHELGSGRSQIFDLASDPLERTDISRRWPERVQQYTRDLEGWSAAQKQRFLVSR